ncbi:hypothetical protein V2J09_023473 [Rumex salicifolius]
MRSTRWWLKGSLRTLNIAVNVTGVAMIIYSLWLLKIWDDGISELSPSSRSDLPLPWFIWACLGVGMVVCFSTLCGYMAVNHTKHSISCLYIAAIFSLILLEGGVIFAIFFNMDLESFVRFIVFHLHMCRWVTIGVLILQVNLVILAMTLCVVGAEPMNNSQSHLRNSVADFRYSFLIPPNSIVIDNHNNVIISEDVGASRTTTSKMTAARQRKQNLWHSASNKMEQSELSKRIDVPTSFEVLSKPDTISKITSSLAEHSGGCAGDCGGGVEGAASAMVLSYPMVAYECDKIEFHNSSSARILSKRSPQGIISLSL